jgi:hypothetical protein
MGQAMKSSVADVLEYVVTRPDDETTTACGLPNPYRSKRIRRNIQGPRMISILKTRISLGLR